MTEDPVLQTTFPSMYKLCLMSRLIPTSTASVERVFSLMNSICTPSRNRVTQNTLSALMRICHEAGNSLTQHQKHAIIENFKAARNRNIPLWIIRDKIVHFWAEFLFFKSLIDVVFKHDARMRWCFWIISLNQIDLSLEMIFLMGSKRSCSITKKIVDFLLLEGV